MMQNNERTAGSGEHEGTQRAPGPVDVSEPEACGAPARDRILTPAFALAWLVNLSQYLGFYLLVTTMALYAVEQFAASEAESGFASSAFVVGATLARLVSGYLVDALGHRRMMLVALAVVVVACALYLGASTLPLLIAVRIVHGVAYAFASTATMAIAQASIPASRRAEGTGYFALGTTLATAVGPALGLFLVGSVSYATVFWASLATAVAGLVLALFLRRSASGHERPDASDRARERFSLRDVAHPSVVPIGAFMLLVGLCYAGVITYLGAYAHERGVATGAGVFFIAYAAAMLVMRFVLGRVQDRRGDNPVVLLGIVAFALALGLLAVATADWQVVVAGALTGLGYGTLMPASQAIAVSAVPPHKLATGISTLLLLTDVGVGLGPIALGVLAAHAGFGAMYGVLALVVLLAAVLYHLVHGRHQPKRSARERPLSRASR